MKCRTLIYCKLIFFAVFITNCGVDSKDKIVKDDLTSIIVDSLPRNTIQIQETFKEEDIPDNLIVRLQPIRENFNRINSITSWTSINKKALWESTEGGVAEYYYLHGQLEKIVTKNFGETFQQLTEYYLLNEQLSFVFEKLYIYNRPFYYDSIRMKENNDNEVFEFEKSKIVEDRSYFENGELLHQITREQEIYSPFDNEWFREGYKRRIADFEKLIKLVNASR